MVQPAGVKTVLFTKDWERRHLATVVVFPAVGKKRVSDESPHKDR